MTPPIFHIGDLVEITGPSAVGARICIGEKFTISEILKRADSEAYSDADHTWYPASSLRLVEELKIGDWVCVVKRSLPGTDEMQPIRVIPTAEGNAKRLDAHREEIDAANERLSAIEHRESAICEYNIETEQRLQKLESIRQHHAIPVPEKLNEIQELRRRIHDLEMSLNGFTNGPEPEYVSGISYVKDPVRDRLSVIEERQGIQEKRIYEGKQRLDAIEKRLTFVEAFQKDEATHATYMTYTYKPGEEGTITVHCSCGQKHEIEATPRTYQADSEASRKDEAELASLCPNGHQIPNGEPIRVTIERGDEAHTYCDTCPGECLNWSEKVLDDMRVD